jgi:hypothetical protein
MARTVVLGQLAHRLRGQRHMAQMHRQSISCWMYGANLYVWRVANLYAWRAVELLVVS